MKQNIRHYTISPIEKQNKCSITMLRPCVFTFASTPVSTLFPPLCQASFPPPICPLSPLMLAAPGHPTAAPYFSSVIHLLETHTLQQLLSLLQKYCLRRRTKHFDILRANMTPTVGGCTSPWKASSYLCLERTLLLTYIV